MEITEDQMLEEQFDDTSQIYTIGTQEELITFLMDILDIKDNVDSPDELQKKNAYRILYELLKDKTKFSVVVEEKYVERVYRDSYYMYFSCKHAQYDRFCKRLFIFEGNLLNGIEFPDMDTKVLQQKLIGAITIRPLPEGKIGRSLINPYFVTDKDHTYLRYAKYTVTVFGKQFQINAFPYSMQDGETTTCAEITILNLLDYFSARYPEYKYILPSEIAEIVVRNGFERSLPARGLGYAVITKVFSEVGFYPRLYGNDMFSEMSQFKRIMHYYVESGIPVALGVKNSVNSGHSIVCLGHGKIREDIIGKKKYAVYDEEFKEHIWIIDSADLCNEYIIMDDGQPPYARFEWKVKEKGVLSSPQYTLGNYEPVTLMVPLYKRMFMEAEDAYDVCITALGSKMLGIRRICPELGLRENPVIIRLFMASSGSFKQRRISEMGVENQDIRARYVRTLFPRFVWVCEIYSKESYCQKKALGEIVVDATASPYDENGILIVHYPYHIMVRKLEGAEKIDFSTEDFQEIPEEEVEQENIFDEVKDWCPFNGYSHNLFRPDAIIVE